jgi:hypothetical protein
MKEKLISLINIGIKPETSPDIAEQIRLTNGISFLGVPVCLPYVILFGLTGNYVLAITFLSGVFIIWGSWSFQFRHYLCFLLYVQGLFLLALLFC